MLLLRNLIAFALAAVLWTAAEGAPSVAVTNAAESVTNVAGRAAVTNNPELAAARQALRDGLWQVARQHAERFADDAARLIVLESFASENRWDDVKRELLKVAHPEENPAFGYYIAVCAGKFAEAAALLRTGGSEAGLAEAKMLEADLHLRSSHPDEARKLWSEVIAMTNAGERAFALASVNLGDAAALRKAYARTLALPLKRKVGLSLARVLLSATETEAEGAKLVRALVKDSPDAEGACDAFVALVAAHLSASRWKEAEAAIAEAMEIWPDAARREDVQEYRGEALFRLRRHDVALEAFRRAEALATDDVARARTILKEGDSLVALGRTDEALARYRVVLDKYPKTETAVALKRIFGIREMEKRGRDAYRAYRFKEAMEAFEGVAKADPERKARMAYFRILCLYGLGRDEEAIRAARDLAETCPDDAVRSESLLWLAKFTYNRGEWKEAVERFSDFARRWPKNPFAPDALLWAARAAFAANDFARAIETVTRLAEGFPTAPCVAPALLVQAEALVELARFDDAILVLDRASSAEKTDRALLLRARLLKADALFATGADNPARYPAALKAYRAAADDPALGEDERLSVAFKIGRVLEKLKHPDEATDQYYAKVVLAYRDGRAHGIAYGSEGETAFVRAAFRLADDFEAHGRDYQAVGVLKLVSESSVPASAEADRRIERISKKGRFL